MKLRFLRVLAIVAIAVAALPFVADYFVIQPLKRARETYKDQWIKNFQDYKLSGTIPPDWKDEVFLRTLGPNEWILAAMYHGACAPGPLGEFDASVLLDSTGRISSSNWSPCASGIEDMVQFWATQYPASNLQQVYELQAWKKVERARAANPRAFGTSGMPDAKASDTPEAGGDT